jgi:bacterioferritin
MRGQYLQLIETIHDRAHEEAERGPVHSGRKGELEYLCELLTDALSAEAICEWESRRLAQLAHERRMEPLAVVLGHHAEVERRVVERIARRIRELGGQPPAALGFELVPSFDGDAVQDLLEEEIEVERHAIQTVEEVLARVGDTDPEAREALEQAVACERQYLTELQSLMPH